MSSRTGMPKIKDNPRRRLVVDVLTFCLNVLSTTIILESFPFIVLFCFNASCFKCDGFITIKVSHLLFFREGVIP